MRLADLLAETSLDDLERLAHEHARADDQLSRPQLLGTIEGVLRSHRFLQEFLLNRQPPTFAIITLLLDAPEFALPMSGFREAVLAETARLCHAIDAKEILARDDQLRVYRKVLYQARANDLLIDGSETAMLGVLRQELEIPQVEHFLIEHHADLREFWKQDQAFVRELHALRSAGLVYVRDGKTLLPEDLGQVIRNVLGVDMSATSARRLYGYLSNHELHEALAAIDAPTSGSKEERIERLLAHMTQPRVILRLRAVGLERLREICRSIGANVSGAKDDLVDRIVVHVAAGRDIRREPEPPPPIQEPRRLDEERFGLLFARLRGYELVAVLGQFELRRSGAKDAQVRALWEAHRSEETLLAALGSSDLEGLLRRLELKTSGSKADRIQRLIEHFETTTTSTLRASAASPNESAGGTSEPATS
jgi:hypothetical protein